MASGGRGVSSFLSNTLPSGLLEYFALKEAYGQKGLSQWERVNAYFRSFHIFSWFFAFHFLGAFLKAGINEF
jgi:hypothetical protein